MSELGIGQRAPLSIQDFENVSQRGLNVKVSDDGTVKTFGSTSIFGRLVAWIKDDKQTNRTTREQFMQSLERSYPSGVLGDLRERLLGDDVKSRPLSTRAVRQILEEVKTSGEQKVTTEQALRDINDKVPGHYETARNILSQQSDHTTNFRRNMSTLSSTLTDIKTTLTLASPGRDESEIDDEVVKKLMENLDEHGAMTMLDNLYVMSRHRSGHEDDVLLATLYDKLKEGTNWGLANPFV